ncbi:MAG TPA: hypothetical protein VGR00_11525 [Thermoanaerobaculia bacterium]|nr:hypothetical protein [Thermoanaerobaculia bacterium]
MTSTRSLSLALVIAASCLLSPAATGQELTLPTPGPTPAPKRSLGGGPNKRDTTSREASPSGSLADTVKRLQESREAREKKDEKPKKPSLGVITNDSLKGPAPTGSKSRLITTGNHTTPGPAGSAMPASAGRDDKGRSEADWRALAKSARDRIAKSESEVKRLDDEVHRLETDFYAWSDGNYRDRVIKPSWEQAKDDLKKARLEIDSAKATLADLEEEARKSNTPPGWLR